MSRTESALAVAVLVAVGVIARVVPHIPNFAPVTATALFCGATMDRRYSLLAPLAIMLLSDYALLYINPFGHTSFDHLYAPWALWHTALPFVYGSFAVSALVGRLLKGREQAPGLVLLAALFCSVQFFLLTNAGVWAAGAYARGLEGLWQSYIAGLPFFRGTLLGDLVFTVAFFGLYELLKVESWRGAPAGVAVQSE